MPAIQPTATSSAPVPFDIYDASVRQLWTDRVGVTDQRFYKSVHFADCASRRW
jgi:hypothetical protein